MKAKGISFELCSEDEAKAHLRTKCQFFRVYAYRKLFPKHVGGPRDGQYVNLDFGHLRTLSNLDRMLRDVLLHMALDVEHFAKVRLLAAAEDHEEDGYTLMRDYRESLSDGERSRIEGEFKKRRNDPYTGGVVRRHFGDMPVWAFCEVVPFGMFADLVRFCADRWGDKNSDSLTTSTRTRDRSVMREPMAHVFSTKLLRLTFLPSRLRCSSTL
ncbi:Abi family protein [Enorma phocaeensis]|uniref:Abi family protein n=1 Tax=Enorma phocaeensis TaxID=1871019 RepID=UPI003B5A9ADC